MKKIIKKLIPKFLISFYHFLLALVGALFYRFPSKKLTVIGVTGTKGKSTVVNLIAYILNKLGQKTGFTSTVNWSEGTKIYPNETKMTMPGRFLLQKRLFEMVKNRCNYAVIEVSSEGIKQFRHLGIDFKVAVFTNLFKEHIEAHGSFEKYKEAKGKLFKKLGKKGISVVNLDDKTSEYFLKFPARIKIGYGTKEIEKEVKNKLSNFFIAKNISVDRNGTEFDLELSKERKTYHIKSKLIGSFNVLNILAAFSTVFTLGFPAEEIKKAIEKFEGVPGRFEIIKKDFPVIIDYAHEPRSLEEILKTIKEVFRPNKLILVFGAPGGGRDKSKRPIMGEIAEKYADLIILTTDDPYDENPAQIIKDIKQGIRKLIYEEILDRKEAIKRAINLAQEGDVVLIAGKGGETKMAIGEKLIPWSDKEIVKEVLYGS